MSKKILVTGASGQVGQALQVLAQQHRDLTFLFTNRHQLDIRQEDQVSSFFDAQQPDVCINCAAYTAVDKAETDQDSALLLNDRAVGFLAKACQENQSHLLHISSDYVYHNSLNRPLRETDPCQPQSIYAKSKLAGDERALRLHPQTHILRTSWVYSPWGNNFVKTMLRLGREREQIRVVYDQIGAPTYAPDIAEALLQFITHPGAPAGIYNFANAGVASWYDFAKAIFDMAEINCQVTPIPSSAYPTPAKRPHYSLLDTQKIVDALGMEISHWRDRLRQCLKEM
ncbi:MAG TPA: dTDP-4-dehydrorhamnose reductase [Saprospiraceae bacterium]|nr:dTDP-4-dehydrorhamnose reductase [Saprospiraceae bacterium]